MTSRNKKKIALIEKHIQEKLRNHAMKIGVTLKSPETVFLSTDTKYGKNVVINLNKSSNNLTITIDDDGPGIEEKHYENVFKPFYKVDKGRGDSKSSVGLGLSITSDIIKSHGGNIVLEKSHLDGLRVKVFFPL